jgi:hypothetical protein
VRFSRSSQHPLDTDDFTCAELEFARELKRLRVVGIPLREWMQVAIRGFEAVEQRLDRRAKRGFAGLVGPVYEHDVGIDRERVGYERSEREGLELGESHRLPASKLRSMSSSGRSASRSRR